jgi:heavy metal translocating P-type ATPase
LGVSLVSLVVSFVLSPFTKSESGVGIPKFFRYADVAWVAVILCGAPIFVSALANLGKKKITSGVLISVAILACVVLETLTLTNVLNGGDPDHGNIFAAGEIAFLMALGEFIEEVTVAKARSGITRLMALAPSVAKIKTANGIVETPVSEVKIGSVAVVMPGDTVGVDGLVISGTTSVDEQILTGESIPADKKPGDYVFGGTQNLGGAIEVEVTKTSDESTVAKLKKMVEEAEGKKAPISRTADRWAAYIVPGAIILSVAVFVLTFFAFAKNDLAEAVLRGITMLVVFCPCALALATPTAVAAGLGAGTRRGVLIKSGAALEALAKVKTVAFDKTGTLTRGNVEVRGVYPYAAGAEHLRAVAGAAESLSSHPLAKAITKYCASFGALPSVKNGRALVGTGVEAEVDGKKITVCRFDAAAAIAEIPPEIQAAAAAHIGDGETVVAVIEDGTLAGMLTLTDGVRPGADVCVRELAAMGVASAMITGDNRRSAEAVARLVGIDAVYAQTLPGDKLKIINGLKESGGVCMAGDGVNDAPALAAADCSIAFANLGSDIAVETADIALMNGDIKNISALKRFADKVLKTIKFNIVMSMTINVAALVLNLFGLLNPVLGALIHNCSSVLVVLNSAFLLKRWQ